MLDFDKWPAPIQWFLGLGVFIGGFVATWFGTMRARVVPTDDRAQAREDERVRVELQAQVNEDKLRRDFEFSLGSARKSFYDELRRIEAAYQHECAEIENRLRKVENEHAAILVEIEALKGWRRPSRN